MRSKSDEKHEETLFVVAVKKSKFMDLFKLYREELFKYNVWQLSGGLNSYKAYALNQEKISKKKEFVLQKNRGCVN